MPWFTGLVYNLDELVKKISHIPTKEELLSQKQWKINYLAGIKNCMSFRDFIHYTEMYNVESNIRMDFRIKHHLPIHLSNQEDEFKEFSPLISMDKYGVIPDLQVAINKKGALIIGKKLEKLDNGCYNQIKILVNAFEDRISDIMYLLPGNPEPPFLEYEYQYSYEIYNISE
jgi:hypothetical protein